MIAREAEAVEHSRFSSDISRRLVSDRRDCPARSRLRKLQRPGITVFFGCFGADFCSRLQQLAPSYRRARPAGVATGELHPGRGRQFSWNAIGRAYLRASCSFDTRRVRCGSVSQRSYALIQRNRLARASAPANSR